METPRPEITLDKKVKYFFLLSLSFPPPQSSFSCNFLARRQVCGHFITFTFLTHAWRRKHNTISKLGHESTSPRVHGYECYWASLPPLNTNRKHSKDLTFLRWPANLTAVISWAVRRYCWRAVKKIWLKTKPDEECSPAHKRFKVRMKAKEIKRGQRSTRGKPR